MGLWSYLKRKFDAPASANCGSCGHFRNDPAYIEAQFKGLTSFSSGYASVRANDGLCTQHDLYLSADSYCHRYWRVDTPIRAREPSIR